MKHNLFGTLQRLRTASGVSGRYYSLPALESRGLGKSRACRCRSASCWKACCATATARRSPKSTCAQLANWAPNAPRTDEIPFVVARVVLQDFTGVPLLCDLAAMRGVAQRMGKNPKVIEPLVPVDLVVDHSVQVDHYGTKNALDLNMKIEFQRNAERYKFMKWGMQAFDTFKVVPPGIGIVHQVNLEYLARGVHQKDGVYYPDTLVGTDSHTTMINGIGVVAWGVGGIEAEAGMLGQPVYILTPDVVGVHLKGTAARRRHRDRPGAHRHRDAAQGEGRRQVRRVSSARARRRLRCPIARRIGNMAPEYGATMGFFAVDDKTIDYLTNTGRTPAEIEALEAYFRAQGLFGMPAAGAIDYSQTVELDLATVVASLAGPKRPQDRIELPKMKDLVRHAVLQAGRRERLRPVGRQARPALSDSIAAAPEPRSSERQAAACRTTASRATWSRWSTTVRRRTASACRVRSRSTSATATS